MSTNHYSEFAHGFECLDPALLSTPSNPSQANVELMDYLDSSLAPFALDANGDLSMHIPHLETVESILSSRPASPAGVFDDSTPFSRPGSPGAISSQALNATRGQISIDSYHSFPNLSFSLDSYEPLTVQSACPSPTLPSFELSPQQVRATSQPPEEHSFQDADDSSAPRSAQSMSFHRIVQPRGKRSHTYNPYSRRRHESSPKCKRPYKPSAPTSAPKLVSLGYNTSGKGTSVEGSSSQDHLHHFDRSEVDQLQRIDQNLLLQAASQSPRHPHSSTSAYESLPQACAPSPFNSEPYANIIEPTLPDARNILQDLELDTSQRQSAQMPLCLALASQIQYLAQLCSEIQSSLRNAFSVDSGGGNAQNMIKLER